MKNRTYDLFIQVGSRRTWPTEASFTSNLRQVVDHQPETTAVPPSQPFVLPFTPPTRYEVAALARASAYLLRAASEAETRRLTGFGRNADSFPLDDFPPALAAAGHLCRAVIDGAPPRHD